jgi:DNA modification methylase
MQTQLVKIKDLKNNTGQIIGLPKNPRILKDDKFIKLKKSLQDDPEMLELREVIAYNNNGELVVICGNMRLKALKELGIKEVPTKILPIETSVEKLKAYTIKDNVSFGDHDWEVLANEWDSEQLEEWGLDVPTFETDEVLEAEEDDFDATPPEQPITVLGDLYEIGEHRLLCGDSTDSDQVAKLMNGSKADMVFTDPPYSITTQGGGVLQKHFTKTAERIKDIVDFKPQEWLQTLPLYFNGNMNTFIFCNKDLIPDYLNFAKENNYNFNILVWCKKQVVPFTGGHHYSDIEYIIYLSKKPIFNNGLKDVEYRKYFVLDNEKSKDHPTIKPLEIISNEIQIASNKNGIVAECFTGSGSTMAASHQLKRKCYGMELDPKYCDVIVKRMIKLDPTLTIKRNGVVTKDFE